jgi:hypothetical protein
VIVVAAVLRLAALVAYSPALMWSDSWGFLYSAYDHFPVAILIDKPVGYPLVLRAIGAGSFGLAVVPVVQHLLGLATGVLVYVLLQRRRVAKGLSALAAAVVLLDSYAIALEQHVLSEAVFTFLLMVWIVLAFGAPPTRWSVAAAGVALAAAAAVRPVALFAVPIWAIYVVWAYPGWRMRSVAIVATAAPLMVYAGLHASAGRGYALSELEGFTLYARVAQIGSCSQVEEPPDLRSLCPPDDLREPAARADPVDFYQWSSESPVYAEFGDPYSLSVAELAHADADMRRFAIAVIASRPVAFAGQIAGETLQFFAPGVMSSGTYDEPILFPVRSRPTLPVFEDFRRDLTPGYVPPARWPAEPLATYQRWVHTPRWLLGLSALAALAALLVGLVPRTRPAIHHRREIFLLIGSASALLVGGVLNHFEVRYAIPAVPLFIAGGVLSLHDLRAVQWRPGR